MAKVEAVRRKLADWDNRFAKYRAAIDSSADGIIVAGWMREVAIERWVIAGVSMLAVIGASGGDVAVPCGRSGSLYRALGLLTG